MSKTKHRQVVIPAINEDDRNSLPDAFPDRMSISEMRKIWNDKKRTYTDEELNLIRDWLYMMANVVVRVVETNNRDTLKKVLNSKRNKPREACVIFYDKDANAA